jgi:pilus assembly protein CpaB
MRRKVVLLVVAAVIAAMGSGLVLLYVSGLSDKATADQQLVEVLTATAEISPGETAALAQSAGKFELTKVPASSVVSGAVTSVDTMGSQVAQSPIYAGQQILTQMFATTVASSQILPVPNGKVAISVELSDPGRVAGFVTPGAHVAIFVSYTGDATGTPSFTRILVSDVEVIGVGVTTVLTNTGEPAATDTTSDSAIAQTILTVALDQRDADRVLFASHAGGATGGSLSFGLLGKGTKFPADAGVTAQDLLK